MDNILERMMAEDDDTWLRGDQWTPEEIQKMTDIKENSFFVTTEPPKWAEFRGVMDPENWGEPFTDPGHDPYNSWNRPRWHGPLRYKKRMQELEEHPERINEVFDDTYEVAP